MIVAFSKEKIFFGFGSVAIFFLLMPPLVLAGENMGWHTPAYIADGDTFRTGKGLWVRISGIDAPEIRHKKIPGSCYGKAARKALAKLIAKKRVRLEGEGRDRYNRLLARVFLADGRVVNEILIREGAAWVYPHGKPAPPHLLSLQREAIRKKRGLWRKIPKRSIPLIGNRTSRRFHLPACRFAGKIRKKNRVRFTNVQAAFMAGYAPARGCIPDPVCMK